VPLAHRVLLPVTVLFHKARAWLLLCVGRREQALELYETILKRSPGDAHALASCAHLHARQGRSVEALKALAHLTSSRPGDAAAWFNYGFMLQQAGHAALAVPAFARSVAIAPGLDQAWYGLGLAHIDLQQFDAAAAALEKATLLQPLGPHGWYRLAEVHWRQGSRDESRRLVAHLKTFEPRVAAQFEREHGGSAGTASPPDATAIALATVHHAAH
jgi:tetratricopeptide (TPR) repeat protein